MYLVEVYLPRCRVDAARAAGARARAAAEALARAGAQIRYVRTTFVPDDETCFHAFEAASFALVEEAVGRAELGRVRVVTAFELSARGL